MGKLVHDMADGHANLITLMLEMLSKVYEKPFYQENRRFKKKTSPRDDPGMCGKSYSANSMLYPIQISRG